MNGRINDTLNGLTTQPVINIINIAFNENFTGAIIMSLILAINVYLGGFSHLTVTTRVVFAMSRDGAFPGSKYI